MLSSVHLSFQASSEQKSGFCHINRNMFSPPENTDFEVITKCQLSAFDETKAADFGAHYLLTTLNCVRAF